MYPFVLDIRCRRHLVYLLRTPAHRLLDHLLDDLKKELFAKMQQNVVLELEKRKRDLQSMVENMLEERRTEKLEVLTDKVHREIKQEFEMYAQATTDAMDSLMGDMKYQLCVHIARMVEKEVSLQLHAKMSDEQKKKEDTEEEKREEEKEEQKEVSGNMQNGPAANRLFYRQDIFKKTVMEEESQSLLANNDSD